MITMKKLGMIQDELSAELIIPKWIIQMRKNTSLEKLIYWQYTLFDEFITPSLFKTCPCWLGELHHMCNIT
jgi:hypothetical protein